MKNEAVKIRDIFCNIRSLEEIAIKFTKDPTRCNAYITRHTEGAVNYVEPISQGPLFRTRPFHSYSLTYTTIGVFRPSFDISHCSCCGFYSYARINCCLSMYFFIDLQSLCRSCVDSSLSQGKIVTYGWTGKKPLVIYRYIHSL